MNAAADDWAVAASSLPLAFAQVREDPQLDMELAGRLAPGSTVVMIASGGETAACLARLPLRLHLVDMNASQLALSRLKWQLAGGPPGDAMAILGHTEIPAADRSRRLEAVLEEMGLAGDVFGPPEMAARLGPDHCGRYEVAFAELRKCLAPFRHELAGMLHSPLPAGDFLSSPLAAAMDAAFSEIMRLENLVCLFGEQATQNPRRPFSGHFAARTGEIIRRLPPLSNPFLWQILAGRFHADHPYDWLLDPRPVIAEAHWHHGRMDEVMNGFPPACVDLLHLSNILDWLSPAEATEVLHGAARVLKKGGRVIIRQLNSSLEIGSLDSGFVWDGALGREMERRDRSYFYSGILVGERR